MVESAFKKSHLGCYFFQNDLELLPKLRAVRLVSTTAMCLFGLAC